MLAAFMLPFDTTRLTLEAFWLICEYRLLLLPAVNTGTPFASTTICPSASSCAPLPTTSDVMLLALRRIAAAFAATPACSSPSSYLRWPASSWIAYSFAEI